jgi:hypothetical protein
LELELNDKIRQLGVSKIRITKDSLYIYNGKSFAQSKFYQGELKKTLDELKDKMVYDGRFGDERAVQKIIFQLSEIWVKLEEQKAKDAKKEIIKDKKRDVYTNKFRDESTGILYEAALVDMAPCFIYMDKQSGNVQIVNQVDDVDRIIKPPPRNASLTDQFTFANKEELESLWNKVQIMNLDEMYSISKGIWNTFIAASDHVITLCAADSIFTYLQDRFPMTHYIFIIGDNDSGKTAFIEVMAATCYRPYSAVSMSDAVLYRVLGSEDEGQAIVLLDEANSLSEKILETLKSGYKKSGFVARVEETIDNKKQPQRFKTFGFKMLAAEYSPTGKGAKGADERFFKIKTKRSKPKKYIAEVLGLKDIGGKSDELERIGNFRKLMLLYKLRHFDDEFKDVQLNVINRDKELTHSLISLFYGTNALGEIIRSLDTFLREKKERKMKTLEAEFFNIVNGFISHPEQIFEYLPEEPYVEEGKRLRTIFSERLQNDNLQARLDDGIAEVPFTAILTKFMENTDLVYKYGEDKKGTIISDEYGDITIQNITGILKDRFGGQPDRHKRYHYYRFSKSIVNALTDGYRTLEPLKIEREQEQEKENEQENLLEDLVTE